MTETNRQWRLAKRPSGMIEKDCFEIHEEPVPEPADGQFVVRNEYFSCDPTQRPWIEVDTYLPKVEIGEVMRAICVGRVVASKNPDFAEGQLVQGGFGWQEYCLVKGGEPIPPMPIPDGVTAEMALSIFGITGPTAYFGLFDIGKPKAGETVLVSGAAGSTGSFAAQIAKIEGCRVIGIAGGPEKTKWLTETLGLDGAIDYKNENIAERLDALCPNGIDVVFENVGGEGLDAALARLNDFSRIIMCGAISTYNDITGENAAGLKNYVNLVMKRGKMQGFIVLDYFDRMMEAVGYLAEKAQQGKIQVELDVVEGFENTPEALRGLFTGENRGKRLVKLA